MKFHDRVLKPKNDVKIDKNQYYFFSDFWEQICLVQKRGCVPDGGIN